MTPLPGPPALVHSVLLASSAKTRWWVGKHVLISVIFPVFRIVHGEMAVGLFDREQLRRRVLGALLAKVRIRRRADSRGEPDPAFLVEHRVVHTRLAVPD